MEVEEAEELPALVEEIAEEEQSIVNSPEPASDDAEPSQQLIEEQLVEQPQQPEVTVEPSSPPAPVPALPKPDFAFLPLDFLEDDEELADVSFDSSAVAKQLVTETSQEKEVEPEVSETILPDSLTEEAEYEPTYTPFEDKPEEHDVQMGEMVEEEPKPAPAELTKGISFSSLAEDIVPETQKEETSQSSATMSNQAESSPEEEPVKAQVKNTAITPIHSLNVAIPVLMPTTPPSHHQITTSTPPSQSRPDILGWSEETTIISHTPPPRTSTPPPPPQFHFLDFNSSPLKPSQPRFVMPEGSSECLHGLVFVFTGQLKNMDRDTAMDLVERHAGAVVRIPTKKTRYVVLGEGAPEKKVRMAEEMGLIKLDEYSLCDLIRERIEMEEQKAREKAEREEAERAQKEETPKPVEREETPTPVERENSGSFIPKTIADELKDEQTPREEGVDPKIHQMNMDVDTPVEEEAPVHKEMLRFYENIEKRAPSPVEEKPIVEEVAPVEPEAVVEEVPAVEESIVEEAAAAAVNAPVEVEVEGHKETIEEAPKEVAAVETEAPVIKEAVKETTPAVEEISPVQLNAPVEPEVPAVDEVIEEPAPVYQAPPVEPTPEPETIVEDDTPFFEQDTPMEEDPATPAVEEREDTPMEEAPAPEPVYEENDTPLFEPETPVDTQVTDSTSQDDTMHDAPEHQTAAPEKVANDAPAVEDSPVVEEPMKSVEPQQPSLVRGIQNVLMDVTKGGLFGMLWSDDKGKEKTEVAAPAPKEASPVVQSPAPQQPEVPVREATPIVEEASVDAPKQPSPQKVVQEPEETVAEEDNFPPPAQPQRLPSPEPFKAPSPPPARRLSIQHLLASPPKVPTPPVAKNALTKKPTPVNKPERKASTDEAPSSSQSKALPSKEKPAPAKKAEPRRASKLIMADLGGDMDEDSDGSSTSESSNDDELPSFEEMLSQSRSQKAAKKAPILKTIKEDAKKPMSLADSPENLSVQKSMKEKLEKRQAEKDAVNKQKLANRQSLPPPSQRAMSGSFGSSSRRESQPPASQHPFRIYSPPPPPPQPRQTLAPIPSVSNRQTSRPRVKKERRSSGFDSFANIPSSAPARSNSSSTRRNSSSQSRSSSQQSQPRRPTIKTTVVDLTMSSDEEKEKAPPQKPSSRPQWRAEGPGGSQR